MPHTKQILFGPGSLEMIRLDLWTQRVEPRPDGTRALKIKFRAVGQYDVYCGMGNMHRVDIFIEDTVWSTEPGTYTSDVLAALRSDEEPARRVAEWLIECELSEWYDPCEDSVELADAG